MAFLYLRYTCPPKKLWEWFEPYIEDEDEMIIYTKVPPVYVSILLTCTFALYIHTPRISLYLS